MADKTAALAHHVAKVYVRPYIRSLDATVRKHLLIMHAFNLLTTVIQICPYPYGTLNESTTSWASRGHIILLLKQLKHSWGSAKNLDTILFQHAGSLTAVVRDWK